MQKTLSKNIVFVLLSTMLFFASFTIMAPTFSLYVKSLGGNEELAGLLTGIFTFAAIFFRSYFATLADRKGRKFVLYLAGFSLVTSPFLYLIDLGFWYLGLIRIFHSISVAAFVTTSQTLLADFSSESDSRGSLVGLYGVMAGVASAIVPYFAFKIIDIYGFTTLFSISAGIGALMVIAVTFIEEPQIEVGGSEAVPAVPFKEILSDRWILIPSITIFSLMFSSGAVSAFLPLHGVSVGVPNVGLFFTISAIVSIISRLGTGFLSDKLGRRTVMLPALIISVLGTICLVALPNHTMLIAGAILTSFGFSTAHTILLTIIIDKTSVQKRAKAITFFTNAWDLGTSFGAMGLGSIALYSYSSLWLTVAGVALLGFVITAAFLPKK